MDLTGMVRGMSDRVTFVFNADRVATEILEILRDTHRIMGRLEAAVDRLDGTASRWEEQLTDVDVSAKRVDRLEEAVLNIERATLSVEAALGALPRSVRQRISREQRNPSAPPERSP